MTGEILKIKIHQWSEHDASYVTVKYGPAWYEFFWQLSDLLGWPRRNFKHVNEVVVDEVASAEDHLTQSGLKCRERWAISVSSIVQCSNSCVR